MIRLTTSEIVDDIIRREGGYVDHPADRGRATNYGITQDTLSQWRGHAVTAEDVRSLSVAEARLIYQRNYIEKPGFLKIESPQVRALTVDCAVHHGVAAAVKMLQRAAHVFPDGIFGPLSIAAVNRMTPAAMYRRLCAERARFFGQLISRDPSQHVFAAGWLNRLASFIEESA